LFELYFTQEAQDALARLKTDRSLDKRFKAVKKSLGFLATDPAHPGLHTHEFTSLSRPNRKVFECYAQQNTPAAYRIFWFYGPERSAITIVAITPHP
jgi:hypothetical protein